MNARRKICVVTGTRADYGLLYWPMKYIQQEKDLELQIVATGMHLSPEFGLTYQHIEEDGFDITDKVEMLISSDTSIGITKSVGLAVIGFADVFNRLKPDIVLLLGDRYEIFAAAQAALFARIPTAHIAGGDTTEGANDEMMRHCITKMAHIHFVTNDEAAARVRQLGENPEYVFNVGSPGIDFIKRLKLLNRQELSQQLDFDFRSKNVLVTYHPVTLETEKTKSDFEELLQALDKLGESIGQIFTKPNSDAEGRIISKMIDDYVCSRPYAKAYTSLGQVRYLSAISIVDAVIGNSSSGLYEVPSFKKPTVNVGNRQKGRLQANSVINCSPNASDIYRAVCSAFQHDCALTINPYGDGEASPRIVNVLKNISDPKNLIVKHFFEVS